MTKLEYYHSTKENTADSMVFKELGTCETYNDYLNLCNKYGVEPYNSSIFNEHINYIGFLY
jgi:hypothetical protein